MGQCDPDVKKGVPGSLISQNLGAKIYGDFQRMAMPGRIWLAFVVAGVCACSTVYVLQTFVLNSSCIDSWKTCSDSACSFADKTSIKLPDWWPHCTESSEETKLCNIMFGISATAGSWNKHESYLQQWWRPQMRGFVWLDAHTDSWSKSLPPFRISEPISQFGPATGNKRQSLAIRTFRIVSEAFRMQLPNVHWFVIADDDTIFVAENLLQVLSKYDHRMFHYIGPKSESHRQSIGLSHRITKGGGGFVISYALAAALEKMQDDCLKRYPSLYGLDERIQACMAELGVPKKIEPGFHPLDVRGDAFGILAAHPMAPLVSIHHLESINPIFPNMTQLQALNHLLKAAQVDASGTLQQSICHNKELNWSISISWGYVIQVYKGLVYPRHLQIPVMTFQSWHRKSAKDTYTFNSRSTPEDECEKPVLYFMKDVSDLKHGHSHSNYQREVNARSDCKWKISPYDLKQISVMKQHHEFSWFKAPRRQCCRILSTSDNNVHIEIGTCKTGETLIY